MGAGVTEANYRFDAKDERLWNGNQPVQITNKACQLLRLFVSNENRLLTKMVYRGGCAS